MKSVTKVDPKKCCPAGTERRLPADSKASRTTFGTGGVRKGSMGTWRSSGQSDVRISFRALVQASLNRLGMCKGLSLWAFNGLGLRCIRRIRHFGGSCESDSSPSQGKTAAGRGPSPTRNPNETRTKAERRLNEKGCGPGADAAAVGGFGRNNDATTRGARRGSSRSGADSSCIPEKSSGASGRCGACSKKLPGTGVLPGARDRSGVSRSRRAETDQKRCRRPRTSW